MRNIGLALLTSAAVVSAAFVVHGQGSTAKHVDPAISKISAAYEAANNTKDLAKLMTLYADDAVEMPPNQPAVRGKSAIEAFYKKQFAEADGTAKITPTESAIAGSIGYEVGTYAQSMKMKSGGATMNDVGKYTVLLKQGGDKQWRVAYVIYNSDNPPMMMPPQVGTTKKGQQ